MNALIFVDIDQDNGHLGEGIKYHEMNNEKKLLGFSYSKNMANFEAFRWNISSSINLLFLKNFVEKNIT